MNVCPLFSIIIPTYNQSQYLGEALDSLLAQTERDWEAIIVNDGSTDSTIDVAMQYCKRDDRFRLISKENGGVGSALNVGLDNAKGEWICWLSSDDLFERRKLEIHKKWIDDKPGYYFFFTDCRLLYDKDGSIVEPELSRWIPDERWQVIELMRTNYVYGNSICVNKKMWEKVGKFDESLRYAQDYDMWLRLMATYPAIFIPERTCITRIHESQGTRGFPEAGKYDSSKSAINFLAHNNFSRLFPEVDLKDKGYAKSALIRALDVASDPGVFLYGLGPHPVLIFRIFDWVYNEADTHIRSDLLDVFYRKINAISKRYRRSYFGFYWNIAAILIMDRTFTFDFTTISYLNIAENNYYQLYYSNDQESISLKKYLERFEDIKISSNNGIINYSYRNILIYEKVEHAYKNKHSHSLELASFFNRSGIMTLYVSEDNGTMDLQDNILCIYLKGKNDLINFLDLPFPWDVLLETSTPELCNNMDARRKFYIIDENTSISTAQHNEHLNSVPLTIDFSIGISPQLLSLIESTMQKSYVSRDLIDGVGAIWEKISIMPRWMYTGILLIPHELNHKHIYEWPGIFISLLTKFRKKIIP